MEGIIQAKKLGSQHISSGAIISDLIAISAVGTQHIADGAIVSGKVASGAMTAGMIPVSLLSGATYSSIQDLINTTQSAGRISGGTITATDPADGTVVVAAGTGFVKITDSPTGVTKFFDWPEETGLALTDNSINYIFVRYRLVDSTPTVTIEVTTDRTTIEQNREFPLGRVYRAGDDTHIVNSGLALDDAIRRNHERLIRVRGFERASGGIITEDGERYLKSTAGVFFLGANKITTDAQNTNNSHRFTWWYHSGGAWTSATGQQQVSNEQYDDGTDLANLTGKRYGVQWVFIHYDSDIQVVCGRGNYTLADAMDAILPAVPSAVSAFSAVAAKIIVQHEGTNFKAIVAAYEVYFPIPYPPDHNDLTNIQGGTPDEYYHLTSGEHAKAISPTFLNLTDTPGAYSGQVAKFAKVNAAEDALEFGSNVSGFTGLLATPQTPADGSVTSAKIAANAIGGPHILAGSIPGGDLANQAVTSAKIGALAVGTPHIAANAITSGKVASGGLAPLTSGKIWAGFTGNIPREEDKPTGATESWLYLELVEDDIILTVSASVADFQTNPATGNISTLDPESNINDNNTATTIRGNTVDGYAEVDYGKPVLIKRWRQFGGLSNNGDGIWKLQYFDLITNAWADWVTGIATRTSADWSDYVTETAKITTKVRLVCIAVDTCGFSYLGELEMIY